jgi:glycosyltransferase involved in cell wall biosynthesis
MTPPPPDVWCAIPVYNNAATIAGIARRSREQLDNVIVIDDGSTDANVSELLGSIQREGEAPTGQRLSSDSRLGGCLTLPNSISHTSHAMTTPLDITVIRHPVNRGKGAALLTAMRYAHERGGKYLITLDGDGQHFPEDIPRFFPHLAPDVVAVGYRHEITGVMPESSRFGREFSDFWIYVESGSIVLDSQSGFRAYPLPASLDLTLDSRRYGFEVEILTRAFWSGLRSQSVPIRCFYPPREQRVSSFDPLRDNARLSLLHARLIARQLLPIPHRQMKIHRGDAESAEKTKEAKDDAGRPNQGSDFPSVSLGDLGGSAVNLAFSAALTAALSIFFSIVLWPWGFIPVAYLAIRLHLNKLIALAAIILCMPPALARWSLGIGHAMMHAGTRPRLERFIGSHVIAFPAALIAAWLVYTTVRRLRPESAR